MLDKIFVYVSFHVLFLEKSWKIHTDNIYLLNPGHSAQVASQGRSASFAPRRRHATAPARAVRGPGKGAREIQATWDIHIGVSIVMGVPPIAGWLLEGKIRF